MKNDEIVPTFFYQMLTEKILDWKPEEMSAQNGI